MPREFALPSLSESERALLAGPGTRLRTGIHRQVSSDLWRAGAWQTAPDGTPVWRVALRSPGAVAIRMEFRNFQVGAGRVWLHNGAQFAGPYSEGGPYGDGHFWSAAVASMAASGSVILEYEPAAGSDPPSGDPPFGIANIAHRARGISQSTAPQSTTPQSAAAQPADAGTSDGADYCQLDPNCYASWQPAMAMVGEMEFEDGGSEYLCSGSLVATRDNSMKPYLLTAGHCINSEAAARTVEVFWTYQTSSCGATPPASNASSTKSTLGADLIDSGTIEQGDYSLLLLKDIPTGVVFSGWDPSDPPMQAALVGIHHPAGSWKRISFGERTGDATVEIGSDTAPGNLYLEIQWDQGRVQPGSSGSPLFSSPGVIVGTLTYGPEDPPLTACEISPSVAGYGRFSNTYQNLQSYFEDWPAATVTPAPASLNFHILNNAAPAAQTVQLTSQTTGQVAFRIRSDAPWIGVSATSGQISAASPAAVKISVDPSQVPQPGQYAGTVTLLAGTAAPQFINVTATVTAPESNVSATVTPAVVTQVNGAWNFQMQLAETAGVATQLTALKINGTDYSGNIGAWFGTTQIAAHGSIQASLAASGVAAGPQYFEFWGIDGASGQTWYRVASTTFR
jgi:hypothetical protein